MRTAMRTRRTLGIVGVALTCPCHAVPLLLLLGGSAGTAWLLPHLGAVTTVLGALVLASLWLVLRPSLGATVTDRGDAGCAPCDRGTP